MLHGELPPCISDLSELVVLNLDNNRLNGPMLLELFMAPSLEVLKLSNNILGGTLEISRFYPAMPKLRILNLHNNAFNGRLPWTFSLFEKLEELTLHGNKLVGSAEKICGLPTLSLLTADCTFINCGCCSECH